MTAIAVALWLVVIALWCIVALGILIWCNFYTANVHLDRIAERLFHLVPSTK